MTPKPETANTFTIDTKFGTENFVQNVWHENTFSFVCLQRKKLKIARSTFEDERINNKVTNAVWYQMFMLNVNEISNQCLLS